MIIIHFVSMQRSFKLNGTLRRQAFSKKGLSGMDSDGLWSPEGTLGHAGLWQECW
jgi:hypothetical protein